MATKNVTNPHDGYFSMGDHTYDVPLALFAKNRQRLSQELKKAAPSNSVVLLQGGGDQGICEGDSSDVGPVFKQEAYFHWAFGVLEPDFYGAVDVATGRSYLFMPKLPVEYAIVMGKIETTAETKERYRVDEVHYIDEMPKVLKTMNGGSSTLLTLNGTNTDSAKTTRPAAFDGISKFKVDDKALFNVIAELRVIKTEMELQALRYITKVSSDAHKVVMRNIKPGMKVNIILAICVN
jgi:Xaa-Pro dipeptidase